MHCGSSMRVGGWGNQENQNQVVDLSADNFAEKKLLQNYPKMWFTSYNLDFHSDLHLHCIHALIVKNGNNEDNAKRLKKLFT